MLSILLTKKTNLLLLFLLAFPAGATVTLIEPLSFGTIAVLDNSVASDITISQTDQTTIVNHIRVIEPGRAAEFVLTDLPGNVQVFTSATVTQMVTTTVDPAPTEQFTLVSVDTAPSVTTDGTGYASIKVGGTLRTSGNGGSYVDVQYRASLQLTFNY
ncbi:DUF4402 domain-containing protein [Thalassomonas haliotis]|uniref:DUF4402 domain-containing protein n=1 Tax=Thalassomonas haliotis TaxID=485448 RepID=A0ABY7VHC5_9GAMM|nr:DUF4402 domain-containing protein [Thalassomonas haliotis]WDE12072.1 DUF4402 domain-containing protein [Thalassomonas haliotis]